jgi:hypothetical protein
MGLNKKTADPANMIIENLAVAPPPVRPSVAVTGSTRSEDDLTVAYRAIIEYNNFYKEGYRRWSERVADQRAPQAAAVQSSYCDGQRYLRHWHSEAQDR